MRSRIRLPSSGFPRAMLPGVLALALLPRPVQAQAQDVITDREVLEPERPKPGP